MNFPDNEPAVTGGSVVAVVTALLALVVAFGVPITDQQREAILAVVGVVAPLAVALLVRKHVTPTAKVEDQVAQAVSEAVTVPPAPAS